MYSIPISRRSIQVKPSHLDFWFDSGARLRDAFKDQGGELVSFNKLRLTSPLKDLEDEFTDYLGVTNYIPDNTEVELQ